MVFAAVKDPKSANYWFPVIPSLTLKGLITIAVLLHVAWAYGQKTHPAVEQWTLRQAAGEVLLDCTIRAGFTCNGITVYRSADGTVFQPIGGITGICGDENKSVSYQFRDPNPRINRVSYYQIEPGGFEPTAPLSFYFKEKFGKDLLIFPQPVESSATVLIENDLREAVSLWAVAASGHRIWLDQGRKDLFELTALASLLPGVYILIVTDDETGSILFSHRFVKK
jgi:hypothetical protein